MADSYIKYSDQTVNSAFQDFYVVPDYQREYVWEGAQVEQLLFDLLEAYEADPKKAYFLGTMVTYANENNFELIDGQQRLTTFFIILCAIKAALKRFGDQTGIIDNLIFSSAYNADGDIDHRYHVQLQYEDAKGYLEQIEKNEPGAGELSQSGRRLFEAFHLAQKWIDDHFPQKEELRKFVAFFLVKTSFIRIETHDITDALKIFETINQRGKGLDPMDLMKNMIFRQVEREQFKELNLTWKQIIRKLEQIDEKLLRFLRYFIMANYSTEMERDQILREDQIYTWFKNNNDQCHYEDRPFQFVQKLEHGAELYARYRFPADHADGNEHLENIPLLAGRSYRLHLMLLLAASNMEQSALARFKGLVESIVYYAVINHVATNVTERRFSLWCREIRAIQTNDQLTTFIDRGVMPVIQEWKQDNELNFMRLGLNSMQQYRVKFILGKITAYVEAMCMGQQEPQSIALYTGPGVEIEHIMPQTCEDKQVYGVSEEEFPVYLNRLGNLTLLENSINRSIQNSTYKEKCEAYRKSRFYLTKSLPALVDQGKDTAINRTNGMLTAWTEWNKQSIEERQRMLYQLSEKIWSI